MAAMLKEARLSVQLTVESLCRKMGGEGRREGKWRGGEGRGGGGKGKGRGGKDCETWMKHDEEVSE